MSARRGLHGVPSIAVAVAAMLAPLLWSAHHPLAPGIRGCTLVRDSISRRSCYAQQILSAIRKRGLRDALRSAERFDHSPRFLAECHEAMHLAGRRWASHHEFTPTMLSSGSLTQSCASGFAHGVSEHVSRSMRENSFHQTIDLTCGEAPNEFALRACIHGIGHNVLRRRFPNRTHACHSLSEAPDIHECVRGYYMERGSRLIARSRSASGMCDDAPPADVWDCYTYLPHFVLTGRRSVDGIDGLLRYCKNFDSPPRSWGCAFRAVNQSHRGLEDVRRCDGAPDSISSQLCAYSIVSDEETPPSPGQLQRLCAPDGVTFGCGAGLGARLVRDAVRGEIPRLARRRCPAQGSLSDACVAGATACWPLLSSDPAPHICSKLTIPTDMRLERAR